MAKLGRFMAMLLESRHQLSGCYSKHHSENGHHLVLRDHTEEELIVRTRNYNTKESEFFRVPFHCAPESGTELLIKKLCLIQQQTVVVQFKNKFA